MKDLFLGFSILTKDLFHTVEIIVENVTDLLPSIVRFYYMARMLED